MKSYVLIDNTGVIKGVGHCSGDPTHNRSRNGVTAIEATADAKKHYFDPITLDRLDKREMSITVTGNTISNIPKGTLFDAPKYPNQIIDDGVVYYSSNRRGKHKLYLTHRQYIDKVVWIVL